MGKLEESEARQRAKQAGVNDAERQVVVAAVRQAEAELYERFDKGEADADDLVELRHRVKALHRVGEHEKARDMLARIKAKLAGVAGTDGIDTEIDEELAKEVDAVHLTGEAPLGAPKKKGKAKP